MKEPYDDERLYSEDEQGFGPVVIRNYREVLRGYNYARYEKRFRALADRHKLSPSQRPKLDENQFASFMRQLADAISSSGEENLLENEKHSIAARRLLIYDDFIDEDE